MSFSNEKIKKHDIIFLVVYLKEGSYGMQVCKYCKSDMNGEFETLSKNKYRFFYNCHNCKSVYEGIMIEDKKNKKILESRWFNPKTNEFEK